MRTTALGAILAVLAGCGSPVQEQAGAVVGAAADVVFSDVTRAAGIEFKHYHGRSGKKYLPETLGAGVAFFDYNNDGWPDLFFTNGKAWDPASNVKTRPALYRNNNDGTFTGVTEQAGLAIDIYGMGIAAADYDNDGFTDLYLTAYGPDRLFRNQGDGTFTDVTAESGIDNPDFGTSAAWFDYDKDGRLDLFVANYVQWTPETDLWCSLDGEAKSYCTPESYQGTTSRLFHNLGEGRFQDATEPAGIHDPAGKGLGVAILDFDNDGWPDIFAAHDTQPNRLYRNNHDGTFTERGLAAGIAFAEDGRARGAMGVDAADYDRTGRPHLLVGNFSNEMVSLFHNEGNGLFVDEAPTSTVGRESLLSLTFGAFFFDYDLDGFLDILIANGHLEEDINRVQPNVTYAQSPQLFRNAGAGRFELANSRVGKDFGRPLVARGAAHADYDRDGDLDIVLTTNNGPAYLYRNDGGNGNNYLRLNLAGSDSNRGAIGAAVTIVTAAGKQSGAVHSGSSYCSQSELPLTFGLGSELLAKRIEVRWPSGKAQSFDDVEANRSLVISESMGLQPDK
jgi:hypothetical protein